MFYFADKKRTNVHVCVLVRVIAFAVGSFAVTTYSLRKKQKQMGNIRFTENALHVHAIIDFIRSFRLHPKFKFSKGVNWKLARQCVIQKVRSDKSAICINKRLYI